MEIYTIFCAVEFRVYIITDTKSTDIYEVGKDFSNKIKSFFSTITLQNVSQTDPSIGVF